MSWDRTCCMSTASSSSGSASSTSLTRENDLPPPPISSLFMFSSSDEQVTNEREESNSFVPPPPPPVYPNYHQLYSPVFPSRQPISESCQCNSHSSQMTAFDISSTFQSPFVYEQYLTSLKSEQSDHLPYLFDNIIYPQPCSPPSPTNDSITYYQLDQANTTTIINKIPPRSHIQPIIYQQLSLVEPPSSNIQSKIPIVKRFYYDSSMSNTTTTTTIITTTPLMNHSNHDQGNLPYARLDSSLFGTYEIWQERTLVGRRNNRREVDVNMGFTSVVSRLHFELLLVDGIEFHLKCLSKNGIFINNNYAKMSSTTVLSKQCTLRFPSTDICISFISLLNNNNNNITSNPRTSTDTSQRHLPSLTAMESAQQQVIYLGVNQTTQTKFEQESTAPLSIHIPHSSLSLSSSSMGSSFSTGSCHEQMRYPEESSTIKHSSSLGSSSSASINLKTEPNEISSIVNSPTSITQTHQESEPNPNKNGAKPPFSYAQLIIQAILSAPDKQMTLSQIYNFISAQYPYYEVNNRGWQNSIRHNLSLNRYFIRLARKDNESGKGSFWRLDENCEEKLIDHAFRHRKQRRRTSSHSQIKTESEEFLLTDPNSSNSSRSISPIRSNTFKRKQLDDDDDDEIEDLLHFLLDSIHSSIINTDDQRCKRPKI